ncbi:MAG: type IX secretion system sortase PorU, partial [Bacteroidetes bacterium]|nr:type IX secretion system sortase PorU [Bacteroidota bacterium]
QQYLKLDLLGGYVENYRSAGLPQEQVREINIGVPSEFGNTIQVLSSEFSNLSGRYLPTPELMKDSVSFVKKYVESSKYNVQMKHDLVAFGEFGLVRNLPVQSIKIYPIQFDPNTNSSRLIKRLVFKINFALPTATRQLIQDNTLESAVLNWNVARNWGVVQKQRMAKMPNSALAAGDWYRFETPTEGIYKIDQAFLQGLGIDAASVDPRTIKIYGYGGYALPENLAVSNNQGLTENAIYVAGESDGKFDTADYVLFYGRPPEFWEYNKSLKRIVRVKNPYNKKNYYWLTYGGANGKRMAPKQSLNIQNAYVQPFTQAFKSLDKDSINIGKSGRDYFGDVLDIDTKSRTYLTSLNGIVPASSIRYKFRQVNASSPIIPFNVQESGVQIYNSNLFGNSDYIYGVADSGSAVYNGTLADERSTLKFAINTGSASAKVYLDYFEIAYKKYLRAVSDNLLFFSKDTTATIEYGLSNFSNSSIQTFDITDFANVQLVSGASISGGQYKFQESELNGAVHKYYAVTASAFLTPANGTKMSNSNIRGNVAGSEMIVITSRNFQTQAERYAAYRSSQSPYKLSTQIFYVDDIMNEFDGGLLDPTAIRDFLKYAYDNWQIKPFYVLLFGDGTYDYLNSEKLSNNFVPTYETPESLDEIYSYPMDDYYARISGNDSKADLAIGRLPIDTEDDAKSVVDKIIAYETTLDKGLWRNTVTLVADDGPQALGVDDGSIHTSQSENLAKNKLPKYFDQNKIYLVAYPTVYTGLGRRKPGVNQAMIDAINNGTLIFNYVGHGNPEVLAHEVVFDKKVSIPQIKNDKYFFLTAATCDFGKYDDPTNQSSAEMMLTMPNAGEIAAFTAARVVFSTANAAINDSLYTNLFRARETNNLPITIGKAFFLTKQFRVEGNDEKFHLFGDPSVRLDEPIVPAKIDSVNGKTLQTNVQVSALDTVKINGSVRNADGSKNQFNGEAIISVFDSEQSRYFAEMNYTVTFPGGLIYRGRVTINNGDFQTEFVVPKDISYENKNGKIVAYVYNNSTDGVGYTRNIIVGGTNPNAVNDGKGPDISIYFDNTNFANSYLVNPDFTLIAKLTDHNGLNTTGTGIGHKLEGIVNGAVSKTIDFTNYFVGDLNSGGKSGA